MVTTPTPSSDVITTPDLNVGLGDQERTTEFQQLRNVCQLHVCGRSDVKLCGVAPLNASTCHRPLETGSCSNPGAENLWNLWKLLQPRRRSTPAKLQNSWITFGLLY